MTKFTVEKLKQVCIELLGNEDFPHYSGNTYSIENDEVLIVEDLKHFLLRIYTRQKYYASVG